MNKKFSLWLNIVTICLCVCAIAIGVYAATTATLTVTGQVGFEAHGVEVSITGTLSGFVSEENIDIANQTETKDLTPIEPIKLNNNTKSIDIGEVYFTDLVLVDGNIPNIVLTLNITNTSKYKVLANVDTLALSNANVSVTIDDKTIKSVIIDKNSGTAEIVIKFTLNNAEKTIDPLSLTNKTLINFVKYIEGNVYIDGRLYAPIESPYAPSNMLDASLLKNGYAVSDVNNGYITSETNSAYEEVSVQPNTEYHIISRNGSSSFRMRFINNDGSSSFQAKTLSDSKTSIVMPENCVGVKISGVTEKAEGLYMVPAPITTVSFIGDSITELPYGWQKNVKDYYYWTNSNASIGGCTIASYGNTGTPTKTRDPIVERYATDLNADADICMVAAGTNDWWYQWCHIGTDEDTETTTFKGALHTLCKGLKEMYSNKPIIFLTPIKRGEDPNKTNSLGYTLEDYANAIIDVCVQYDIDVIDLYHTCPLDPSISEHQEQFFDGNLNSNEGYTFLYDDTTHPNVYGARVQSRYVIDALNNILK